MTRQVPAGKPFACEKTLARVGAITWFAVPRQTSFSPGWVIFFIAS